MSIPEVGINKERKRCKTDRIERRVFVSVFLLLNESSVALRCIADKSSVYGHHDERLTSSDWGTAEVNY
jgi:hypothetical protein